MFTRCPGAKIGPGDQYRPLVERSEVQYETRVVAPSRKQAVVESCSGDPLQIDGRDDLVGIDIGPAQRNSDSSVCTERFHCLYLLNLRSQLLLSSNPPVPTMCRGQQLRRPQRVTRDGYGRPCPARPATSGWMSTRTAHRPTAGPDSCPGTWNSPPAATPPRRR